jgi:hypothetical protein
MAAFAGRGGGGGAGIAAFTSVGLVFTAGRKSYSSAGEMVFPDHFAPAPKMEPAAKGLHRASLYSTMLPKYGIAKMDEGA